jgi:hypothetical protein
MRVRLVRLTILVAALAVVPLTAGSRQARFMEDPPPVDPVGRADPPMPIELSDTANTAWLQALVPAMLETVGAKPTDFEPVGTLDSINSSTGATDALVASYHTPDVGVFDVVVSKTITIPLSDVDKKGVGRHEVWDTGAEVVLIDQGDLTQVVAVTDRWMVNLISNSIPKSGGITPPFFSLEQLETMARALLEVLDTTKVPVG